MISVFQWFVDGRKNYKGPQIELVGEDLADDGYQNRYPDKVDDGLVEAEGNGIGELNGHGTGELDGEARRAELKG